MTLSKTRAYSVEAVDLPSASDALLAEVNEIGAALSRERVPEDPPLPLEGFIRRVRNRPAMFRAQDFIARGADGTLVARGAITKFEADTNAHLREGQIDVLPAHRRNGVARLLLRELARAAGDGDDIVIEFFTTSRIPAGPQFLEHIGAKQKLTMHTNQLLLADLDRAMVREWASLDPRGYRIEWIDSDVPERLMQNVIVAYDAMNSAPRGDSSMDDWHTTPEQIREWDRSRGATTRQRRLAVALDANSGETAGYTELVYDPQIPPVIWQQGTAVIPAHRGRGLGKWLKAAMLERAMSDWPLATIVRTGNADSNAPMLAINRRLGFRQAWAQAIWEIGIVDLRRYLERRPD